MFAVRNYQQGVQRLCAACDEDLLDRSYSEGALRLDVTASFYDGMRVGADELRAFLRQCTIANLVGEGAVGVAVELGIVDERNVKTVEGVPHAQFMLLME